MDGKVAEVSSVASDSKLDITNLSRSYRTSGNVTEYEFSVSSVKIKQI